VKIAVIVVIALAIAGGIAGVGMKLFGKGSVGASAEQEATVRVEPVSRGELVEIVSAPGQIQPKTKVSISAKTTARIMELPFDEGMAVKKGDMIVQLDAKDAEAQLKAAESRRAAQASEIEVGEARLKSQQASIEVTKVQLADAERKLRQQKELLATQSVARDLYEVAEASVAQFKAQLIGEIASLEAARGGLDVQRHQLEAAAAEILRSKDNLSYTTITSPIDGIVTRMNAKVGEMVVTGTMTNMGTVILEVSDLSEMQVDAQIDENTVADVKAGQKAKVRISAFQDQTFDGEVRLVGLDVADSRYGNNSMFSGNSNQGRWYRAKIVVDTAGKRVPVGLSADVDIETQRHTNVIKVPTQAVMGRPVDELPQEAKDRPEVDKSKQLATVCFVVKDGKAKVVPVTIGASDMTHTHITAGLKDGEHLVIGPYKALPSLKDGQKVKEDVASATKPATAASTKPATTTTTTAAK
jgi:HlyD family secretion protein